MSPLSILGVKNFHSRQRHYVLSMSVRSFVRPSVRPFLVVCYQTCEYDDMLKTNELIVMQTGTRDPRGKDMKRCNFVIRGGRCIKDHSSKTAPKLSSGTGLNYLE